MKKIHSFFIPAMLALFFLLPFNSCSKNDKPENKPSENKTAESKKDHQDAEFVKTISTVTELQTLLDSSSNLLVFDLYADWCIPCKVLAPIFSDIAKNKNENAKFYRIDVDKSPELSYAFGVRGIPYVVFVKNKEVIYAMTGVNPKEQYEKVINSCGDSTTNALCMERLKKL
ncbi:MAG: thioredoxin family protein [Fibrobacter sp.]|nr:thioredoxin family protein [Fibrobacter sp.]